MNGRTLGILALIAVVAIGAALVVQSTRASRVAAPGAADDPMLVPGLLDRMESVAWVRIADAAGEITLAKRADGSWTDLTHAGYPARAQSIGQLVLALAKQDAGEAKTGDPALFQEIGVEDPAPGPDGTVIEMKDASGGAIATVILGKTSERVMGGRFVRVVGSPRARQVILNTAPTSAMREWVDPQVVRIPRDRIASITVQAVDGKGIEIERAAPDSQSFVVRGFEGEISPDPMGAMAQLTSAIAWIDFEEVRPSAGDPPPDSRMTTTYRMRDAWTLEIDTWSEGDVRWMRARVSDPITPAEGEAGERLAAELAGLRAAVTGWDYKIPAMRYETFRPTFEALTAPSAKAPPQGAIEQSPAPN